MKTLLTISFLLFSSITFGQQKKNRNHSVYKYLNDECSQIFKKPTKHDIFRTDSLTYFRSDSGNLIIKSSILKGNVYFIDSNYKYHETAYSIDTVFNLLFTNDFLNYDELLQTAKFDRKAESQYGEKMDNTFPYRKGDIELLYSFNLIQSPKFIKKNTISFEVRVYFKNYFYAIHDFYLILQIPDDFKEVSLYEKIKNAKLRCLWYSGTEI